MRYLWRAVDHEGEVLDSFAVRGEAAALRFMKKVLKRHGSETVTTDGLRSYKAVIGELGCAEKQEIGRWANNRGHVAAIPLRE